MQYKKHRPLHIYSRRFLFLTGRTLNRIEYFKSDESKILFVKVLKECLDRFQIKVYAWVLLNNHYHLLVALPEDIQSKFASRHFDTPDKTLPAEENWSSELSSREIRAGLSANQSDFTRVQSDTPDTTYKYFLTEFARKLHKDTARWLNNKDNTPARQVWFQYWDYYLRNEADFWKHFNYLVQNPLKHKLVKSLSECFNYQFSTNPHYLKLWGEDGFYEGFEKYPVRDWTPREGELE